MRYPKTKKCKKPDILEYFRRVLKISNKLKNILYIHSKLILKSETDKSVSMYMVFINVIGLRPGPLIIFQLLGYRTIFDYIINALYLLIIFLLQIP